MDEGDTNDGIHEGSSKKMGERRGKEGMRWMEAMGRMEVRNKEKEDERLSKEIRRVETIGRTGDKKQKTG